MKNELRELEKRHVVSVLDRMFPNSKDHPLSEEINALREATLLQVLSDEGYRMAHRCKAAEVLAYRRKSPQLVSPTLEILNSFLDSDMDSYPKSFGPRLIEFFRQVPTPEVHQGLTKFLNRLLAGKPEDKDLFLMETVLSLAWISIRLDTRDSVSILRKAMSHFETPGYKDLSELVEYFNQFNEPAGIKEILTQHVTAGMPDVENRCLELLQKYQPEFVEKWRAERPTDNSNA